MLGKPRLDPSRGSSANNSRTSRAAEVLWHANREDLGTVRWIGEDFRDALGVHVSSLCSLTPVAGGSDWRYSRFQKYSKLD